MIQTEHSRSSGLSLFLAFVGGALVGGVAAVLFAPHSGSETRRRIAGSVDDTKKIASRVPHALCAAASAAQAALATALEGCSAALKECSAEDAATPSHPESPPSDRS